MTKVLHFFSDVIYVTILFFLQLGMQISESKAVLESALELSRDMYEQMSYINISVENINKELDTQRHKPDLPVNAIYVTVCNICNLKNSSKNIPEKVKLKKNLE